MRSDKNVSNILFLLFCSVFFFYLRALDKNEYNHITATYFLLAERKLRAYRQEEAQKRRPELSLSISGSSKFSPKREYSDDQAAETNSNHFLLPPNAGHLGVVKTLGADVCITVSFLI